MKNHPEKLDKEIKSALDQKKIVWSAEDIEMFNKGYLIHGNNSNKISEYIGTKTAKQCSGRIIYYRNHPRKMNKEVIEKMMKTRKVFMLEDEKEKFSHFLKHNLDKDLVIKDWDHLLP